MCLFLCLCRIVVALEQEEVQEQTESAQAGWSPSDGNCSFPAVLAHCCISASRNGSLLRVLRLSVFGMAFSQKQLSEASISGVCR